MPKIDTVMMTEGEWAQLVELIDRVTRLPGSWEETAAQVRDAFQEYGDESTLEKFVSWFEE